MTDVCKTIGASGRDPSVPDAVFTPLAQTSVSRAGEPAHPAPVRPDGCPSCVLNVETALSSVALERGFRCGYLCSDCGHAWTTDWRD